MGAGDIFRGVAQGLLGAGSGAANYALERDKELREQRMKLEYLKAARGNPSNLAEIAWKAAGGDPNKAMSIMQEYYGSTTGAPKPRSPGDRNSRKVLRIVNDKTGRIRFVEEGSPGETLQLEDGERVISTTSGKDPFKKTDSGFFEKIRLSGKTPVATPTPTATSSPAPATTSVPPRMTGESLQAYSRRTGIQFK